MVAGGGPNIWVDTMTADVIGYSLGCPETRWSFREDVAREIADSFNDLFDGLTLKTS